MASVFVQNSRGGNAAFDLRTADILLVHTKRSFWGWIIRRGTRCYWNHALMICSSRDPEQGYDSVLAVDAKTSGIIAICRIAEYLNQSARYDVAIKRLEADWFQNDGMTSTLDFRGHVCNIAMNEVNFRLGSRLTEFIDRLCRQLTIVFRFVRRKIWGTHSLPSLPWNIRPVQVKAFTCGGFIQWCYYKGMFNAIEERGAGQSLLEEVVFNPRVRLKPTPFELLTSTPADLANCDRLSWKYLIKDGILQYISSSEEVSQVTMPA